MTEDEPKVKKSGSIKDIDGIRRDFKIIKEVRHRQHNYNDKIFVFQLLYFLDKNEKEIRIGYYIKGKKPKIRGKWVWGQYCPFLPESDFKELIQKAEKEGLI